MRHVETDLEHPLTAARRTLRALAAQERAGVALGRAEIVVAPTAEHPALEEERLRGRVLVAHAFVRHLSRAGGRLDFVTAERCSRSVRSGLLALVDALLAELGASNVELRVQFRPAHSFSMTAQAIGLPDAPLG